jgi:very-short-patch-repair endonuclease
MNERNILAKVLRKNSTIQERRLWNMLKNHQFHGLKFKRQQPMGNYIVDFICKEAKIIIEVDGGQHNEKENILSDNIRTQYLENRGYKVLRFWNNEVYENIEGVIKRIEQETNPLQEL